ncbi:methylenetetrahydrofolate reductase [Actinopolymorpha singaporensis]|uniref:Methylenetetrahydrofolate reductase n=1 Tax=Actinopolymorpha singaporensis TaxID=117157 RepID=A0A1H1LG34_9ACTN|nr:methylenetetrahydrofolate reductase [Actinopolymorpha singaporensis]SDR72819.1 5,10-methylenetetrahydrofolate reductase [Actinopolymorpha singaporensis]
MPAPAFEVVCEVEPPARPDLAHVRRQIEVLGPVADAFLAPDNHLGRATISSVAVAHEIQRAGGRGLACLNARDRNLLGLRRDLLTAAAYGVERFVFVYGDKPTSGNRTGDLTVRAMLEEVRRFAEEPELRGGGFRAGVAAGPGPLPAWKRAADFVFTQVGFDVTGQVRWRETHGPDCPVYAGVLVLSSEAMARRLAASIPDLNVPEELIRRVGQDRRAGVEAACEQVERIRDSGAFDGVHLVTGVRFGPMAEELTRRGLARPAQSGPGLGPAAR